MIHFWVENALKESKVRGKHDTYLLVKFDKSGFELFVAVFATALFILALFFAGVWPTVPPPAELKPSLPVVVKSPPVGFAQRRVDFDRPSRTQRGPRSAANHEKAETAEELRGSRIREAATDPTSMFDMSNAR